MLKTGHGTKILEVKPYCEVDYWIPLYTHPVKELTDRIAELENQLGFIVSINRAGLGVVTATPMPSEKIEKIWNAIEEQRDDNFHYGWKKCEQYYGFAHPAKEQDIKYDVTIKWDDKTTHHEDVSGDTPLHHTHPVKELTDEEIIELTPFKKYPYDSFVEYEKEDLMDFARAILRKAQENG